MGGRVTTLGDVYSYGILLLEMFTGKRPTDDKFKDGLSIHSFVATALPEGVMEIVDRSVLWEEEGNRVYVENEEVKNEDRAIISDHDSQNTISTSETVMDCMVSVLKIGLSCSASLPRARMPMNIVVNKMYAIRDSFQRSKKRNERTTP